MVILFGLPPSGKSSCASLCLGPCLWCGRCACWFPGWCRHYLFTVIGVLAAAAEDSDPSLAAEVLGERLRTLHGGNHVQTQSARQLIEGM